MGPWNKQGDRLLKVADKKSGSRSAKDEDESCDWGSKICSLTYVNGGVGHLTQYKNALFPVDRFIFIMGIPITRMTAVLL